MSGCLSQAEELDYRHLYHYSKDEIHPYEYRQLYIHSNYSHRGVSFSLINYVMYILYNRLFH